MDLQNLRIINFQKICRLCLNEQCFLTEIFESSMTDNCLSIDEKIMACTSIKICKNDGFPSRICAKCLSNVNAAFDFKLQCENADNMLHIVKNLLVASESITYQSNAEVSSQVLSLKKGNDTKSEEIINSKDVLVHVSTPNEACNKKENINENVTYYILDGVTSENLSSHSVASSKLKKKSIETSEKQIEPALDTVESELNRNHADECSRKKREVKKNQLVTKKSNNYLKNICKMPCPYCNKRLTRIDDHIRLLHRNRIYKCIKPECGAEFLTLKNLQSHQLNCFDLRKPFKCWKCAKEFHRKSNFKAHVRRHGTKKDFQCQFCEKAFVDSTGLKRHFLKHHEPEQEVFISVCCGKKFKSKEGLKKHIQKSICGNQITCIVADDWESPADNAPSVEIVS